MYIKLVEDSLKCDMNDNSLEVTGITEQSLIWENHTEVRAYCKNKQIFTCLYEGDDKIGKFVEVIPEVQK